MNARNLKKCSLLAGLVIVTACTESAQAPTAPDAYPVSAAPSNAITATPMTFDGDTAVQQITVEPSGGTFTFGGTHMVEIESASVCDPARSTYGVGEWDKPCVVISRPVVFTVRAWRNADGHPVVTFNPDVRFAPGKVNRIWLKDPEATADQMFRINWCATRNAACLDESVYDGSVATRRDAASGLLYRRVKHFSGYTVTAD